MHLRFFLLLLLGAAWAHGAEVRLSLENAGTQVRARNPELRALRWRIEEARGRMDAAGRWTNPEVGVEYRNDTDFGEGGLAFSVDQKFPLTRRLLREKEVSAKQVELAEWEVRDAERLMVAEAETLTVELLTLDKQHALLRQQAEVAAQQARFIERRVKSGEISPLDAQQAKVDSRRLALEARKLETERLKTRGRLQALLGLGAEENLVLEGGLPKQELPASGDWARRADWQQARAEENAARSEIALAEAKRWDDISVGVVVEGEREENDAGRKEDSVFVGFRVSLPLPLWNDNSGEVREKKAAAERVRLGAEALMVAISHELRLAREEMRDALELAREVREELLPLAQEQVAALEKAYAAGQAELLAVLKAREQCLQLEDGLLAAERNFSLAWVRYRAATANSTNSSAITQP